MVRNFLCVAGAFIFLFVALRWLPGAEDVRDAKDAVKANEAKKLQGNWTAIDYYFRNSRQPQLVGAKATFDANAMTLEGHNGTFTIDPGKRPKELTFTYRDAETKRDVVVKGIYMFDDDQLVLAMGWSLGADPHPRPDDFCDQCAKYLRLKRAEK
jgi:uncharacterized protein (TIGR03067 family)